jgi:hypothetical protein
MTTNYPTSIDNFVNPAGTATLASPDHAGQHTDINDAVEAIETELGTLPKGSKASVKARLDDVDTALALVGSAARPVVAEGAYLSGSGLVLSGFSGEYARTPDQAALEISGDIDIQVKLAMPDWTPSTDMSIINKWGAGALAGREWDFRLGTTGGLSIVWNNSAGTLLSKASTATISAADGAALYVRVTMDVDNGASGFDVKFYTSLDGSAWTQLGTTVTTAGSTSIITTTANALTIGGTVGGSTLPLTGTVQRAIIRNGYDGAGTVVFDADFSTQTANALAFTESSTNAATVTIITTRYSYGIPNAQSGSISTSSLALNVDRYQRFVVTKATVVDMVLMEVTTGPASAATVYFGLYAADTNFQPTGNVLLATDIAVGTSATGVFTKQVTPVTLQAGTYLLATNPSVTMTVRTLVNGNAAIVSSYGASGAILILSRSRTAATFGNSPSGWNTATASSTVGSINYALLRWSAA